MLRRCLARKETASPLASELRRRVLLRQCELKVQESLQYYDVHSDDRANAERDIAIGRRLPKWESLRESLS